MSFLEVHAVLMKKIILFLYSLILAAVSLSAQNSVRIYGYIIDTNNRGIANAEIYVKGTPIIKSTNVNGFYELETEYEDSLVLVYSHLGHETLEQLIIPSRQVMQITVELPFLSRLIDEVEVSTHRRQTSTVQTLDPSKLRAIPNVAGGIEALLVTFTGVTANNELSSQYNVRGGSYDENSVYVNGIEVYRPQLVRMGEQEGLSFINPDMVENVSFSSGGFEARYGDKMSSVLDIQYKKPTAFEGTVSMGLLGASAYVGTANKKLTQMHGIRYKTNQYLFGTLDTQGEYSPNYIDYQTSINYTFSPQWELNFLGNFSQNSYQFTPVVRETSYGTLDTGRMLTIYFDGGEKDLFQTYFGALSLNYKKNERLNLSFNSSAYATKEKVTYDISGSYFLNEIIYDLDSLKTKKGDLLGVGKYHQHARNNLNASVVNVGHTGSFRLNDAHTFQWGITSQWEKIDDKISEWEWVDSVGYSIPYGSNGELFYNLKSNNKLDSWRGIAYWQDTYRWETSAGRWSAVGGLRANYWSYNKEFLLSPRVSLSLLPNWKKDFAFRFSTGIYYQSPFYKELRMIVTDSLGNNNVLLNSDIEAQQSYHFVLGGDYYFRAWGRPFKFTTEAYMKWIENAVSYDIDNIEIRYSGVNDSRAYAAGVDFKLFGELVPGVDSWVNLSLMNSKENIEGVTHTRSINGKQETLDWIYRPNAQRYSFSFVFQDYLPNNPKYRLQLKVLWADGFMYGTPGSMDWRSSRRSKPYRRVDIGASRVFSSESDKFMRKSWLTHVENIWLNIDIFNLMEFQNVSSYFWLTDAEGYKSSAPNNLTDRLINFKLTVDFK